MAKQKQVVQFGATPRVDLLPDAQREDRRLERLVPRLGLAIVASAVVAGLIWAAGFLPVQAAQQRLVQAEGDSSALVTQIAGFADLQKTLNRESELARELTKLSGSEVMFGDRLEEIIDLMPSQLELIDYRAELVTDDPATGGSSSQAMEMKDLNPLCVAEAATLTVTFHGPDFSLAPGAEFVDRLNEKSVAGFQCVVGTKVHVKEDGEPQDVTVQIALGEAALAKRFEEDQS